MTEQEFIMLCVYILTGLFGLCVGSFLNVVIYRLPNEMSLSKPSSHCTVCDYTLKWYDNIPVISYVILGGKCRKCKTRISPRYMAVELANMLLWLLSVCLFWQESILYACVSAIVSSTLICIFFIDLEHMLIFNRFTVIIAACGVAAMFCDGGTQWYDHLIGLAVGGGIFVALYYGAYFLLKKEGLGLGDVKYAAAAGLLLGWQKLILAVLIASIAGAIGMYIANRIRNTDKRTEHPFGPYLASGTLIAMLIGNPLITWYIGLLIG